MNKRSWLRSQGFVVGQRGRLQPAAQQAIDKAIADGVDFSTKGDSNVINTRHGTVVVKKRTKRKSSKPKPTPPQETNWDFMREIQTGPDLPQVCNVCLYSVGWCQCGSGGP